MIAVQVNIPGFSSKFKATIPKLAKPGDLISIALPRTDPGSADVDGEVCRGKQMHDAICFVLHYSVTIHSTLHG